jgi:Mn2+/Fe2+ NRAMP family transporter
VEEELEHHIHSDSVGRPRLPQGYIRNIRIDTAIGMVASSLAQWFIIMTTGTVLFAHGVTNIATAADAAKALEPLVRSFPNSGQVAKDLFAVGVVGLGLLGIPVMAGSSSYAISEAMGWKEGLSRKLNDARGFYGVIIVSTLVGLGLNFIGVDPIKALVFAAVFNGVASVPLLFVIGRINGSTKILGAKRGGVLSRTLVWVTFAVMAVGSLALAYALVSTK